MMNMTSGIYYYFDTEKNYVVYVGKDSHIDENRRHKAHMTGSNLKIDSILQNNPDRYEYRVYCEGNFSNEELNNLEIQTIKLFDTLHREDAFNYTEGGDGFSSGENHPMYGRTGEDNPNWKNYARVVKVGFTPSGKQIYALKYNGERPVFDINKKELEKLADRINKLENKDEEIVNQIIEEYKARRENKNKKNYATVVKVGFTSSGKQQYTLRYNRENRVYDINKEELEKLADRINKLEYKDEEIVNQIIEEYKANKKKYATVIKNGFINGKQNYALRHNGKTIKQSIYKEKLEKLAEERNNKNKEEKEIDGTSTIEGVA